MISILAIKNEDVLNDRLKEALLSQLPLVLQERVARFRRWQDQQANLLGKLLLQQQLTAYGLPATSLNHYQLDAYERPFINGAPDFNISHTNGMVVCAVSDAGRIGIDVEQLNPIDLTDFRRVFTAKEYHYIHHATDSQGAFFELWTKKEAVMKADGRGFHLDPQQIMAMDSTIIIDNKPWLSHRVNLTNGFDCHVAMEDEKEIQLKTLEPKQLLRL